VYPSAFPWLASSKQEGQWTCIKIGKQAVTH